MTSERGGLSTEVDRSAHGRRRFLASAAGVAFGAAVGVGSLPRPAAAAEGAGGTDLSAWFENTDNATGIVDARGRARVDVEVGVEANGGAFGFGPAAVRVDPGATVVWTWLGAGGTHNVVSADGSFESDYHGEAGATFEYVPDTEGVFTYACAPHEAMGMKGALVVGAVDASLGGSGAPAGTAAAESVGADADATDPDPPESFGGWLANTDNYDGVADERGASEVTVEVGADGNGGAFAFEPAAVRVDPGTTVVWEWVGPEEYDVADPELGYRSDAVAGVGHRFAVEFDGDGLSRYGCTAYGDRGMHGVVVVGEGPIEELTPAGAAAVGGAGAAVSAPILYGLREHVRDTTGAGRRRDAPPT